jgi:hypothetical protein
MTTTTTFSFTHRPLVPFAHDYVHGDSEPWHQHDCAQLLHSLSGVVRVDTASGCWVVPRARRLAAGGHAARAAHDRQRGGANAVYRSAGAGRSPASCQIVQITPLLRELILASLA